MELLANIVESLLEEHRKLIQLLKKKKELLIKGDMDALKQLLTEEEQHIRTIQLLEKERITQGEAVAKENSIPLEELTLSKLLDLTKGQPSLQSRLIKIDQEFPAVISLLRGINELNGQLINQSLQQVQATIDLLTDVSPRTLTYNEKEEMSGAKRSFFDTKI